MEKLPEKQGKDYAYGLLKAALTAIPFVGSPAAEVMSTFLKPPFEKRKEIWCESIANEIEEILSKIDNHTEFISNLQNNDEFISTLASATQAAMRTHHADKILAFKNLTFNTLNAKETIEYIKIRSYIYYVEQLEPVHLRVLNFFNDQKNYYNKYDDEINKSKMERISKNFDVYELWDYFNKDFKHNSELMDIIVNELFKNNFISQNNITLIDRNCMTETGKEFLKYISEYKG